jgi:hypothetical protein
MAPLKSQVIANYLAIMFGIASAIAGSLLLMS